MRTISALLLAFFAGCTSISEVTKTGRDTYMIGSTVRGSTSGDIVSQAAAIQAANTYCQTTGKTVQVTGTQSGGVQGFTPMSSVVHFTCINE